MFCPDNFVYLRGSCGRKPQGPQGPPALRVRGGKSRSSTTQRCDSATFAEAVVTTARGNKRWISCCFGVLKLMGMPQRSAVRRSRGSSTCCTVLRCWTPFHFGIARTEPRLHSGKTGFRKLQQRTLEPYK